MNPFQRESIPQPAIAALGLDKPPIAVHELPQSRLDVHGAGALSDTELLSFLITGSGIGRRLELAGALIASAGSLAALSRWHLSDFRAHGVGETGARTIISMIEMSRRISSSAGRTTPILNRPELIFAHFRPLLLGLTVEKFWVLCLDRKNRLIKNVEVTSGTATSSLAHPREVFRAAIQNGATATVCVHNHPSGDPMPSAADVQVTRQLSEAARAIDMEFQDHVIVGLPAADPRGMGYYSFREAGVI